MEAIGRSSSRCDIKKKLLGPCWFRGRIWPVIDPRSPNPTMLCAGNVAHHSLISSTRDS